MAHLIAIVMADGKKHLLNVVIEGGHVNVKDTVRIFIEMKFQVRQRLGMDILGTIAVAGKNQSPPLMLCDFQAYTYSKMRASKSSGQGDYADVAPMPRKREAGLTFLELLPHALQELKAKFEKDRKEAADAWRARRDARRNAAS